MFLPAGAFPRLALLAAGSALATACAMRADVGVAPRPSPFPTAPLPAIVSHTPPPLPVAAAGDVIATALAQRGVPYRLGGEDPARGFDCSGLVRYVLGRHAVDVPRTASEQFQAGAPIQASDLRAGDLVFFTTIAPGASHVGIVVGPDRFVHAPASNGVVRVEPLSSSYWQQRFIGARRVLSGE